MPEDIKTEHETETINEPETEPVIEPSIADIVARIDMLSSDVGRLHSRFDDLSEVVSNARTNAINDGNGNGIPDGNTGTSETIPDVGSEPTNPIQTETGPTEKQPIKRPKREHPYYQKLW